MIPTGWKRRFDVKKKWLDGGETPQQNTRMPSTPPILLGKLNGYEFFLPQSGGKAGFGHNRTSTIQVRRDNCVVKQIRFTVDSKESRSKAVVAAKIWAFQQDNQRESA